jgi:hypothetical protein
MGDFPYTFDPGVTGAIQVEALRACVILIILSEAKALMGEAIEMYFSEI